MALDFDAFDKNIQQHESIALTAPSGADGDSVGTQCALYEYIITKFPEKKCFIINEDPCPDRYRFLKYTELFQTAVNFKDPSPQLWIVVDGGPNRLGDHTTTLWKKAQAHAQIDHHTISVAHEYCFTLNEKTAAATTEIVFKLFEHNKFSLSASIAQALYVGLIYDTGLFKHSNTTPEIMRIGAKLLEADFNHTETAEKAMLLRSEKNLKLLKTLLNNTEYFLNGKNPLGVINFETLSNINADSNDKDGLIDVLFLTPQCQVACLLFEIEKNHWKVSFRSRGPNVAALAKSLDSNGGGHILAAGCSLTGNESDVKAKCQKAMADILS